MQILIIADGEGISQITDHRECWPAFPQYWKTGRTKFTADVSAAALGLLEGGASEVVVLDGHGLQWNNVLPDKLPKRTRLMKEKEKLTDFDLWFSVGAHARCGADNGFISHTSVPYFRVALNGTLATETHGEALDVGSPPLGVTGDAALDSQLNGFLLGVPFLPVKRSLSRSETRTLYPGPTGSARAIRSFAKACVPTRSTLRKAEVPHRVKGSFSVDKKMARKLDGKKGLRRISPSVLTTDDKSWRDGAGRAWTTVAMTAVEPFLKAQGNLNLVSEESMQKYDSGQLKPLRKYLVDWVHATPPGWID